MVIFLKQHNKVINSRFSKKKKKEEEEEEGNQFYYVPIRTAKKIYVG